VTWSHRGWVTWSHRGWVMTTHHICHQLYQVYSFSVGEVLPNRKYNNSYSPKYLVK